ncbi:heterokaryon incompatibility protein-domain-containing protein [Cerioporus squamosus]|nr:heterokaryon incompatibility protein-domain-containing protein [Cerioporus squamosus]
MWLLSTTNGPLSIVYFNGPDDVTGGYAALSHVWQGAEQSFQDVQQLIAKGVALHDPAVSPKIRDACRVARGQGFAWIWIDTCCIDKSSSAELSEAINSMFQWYAQAKICYAYLYDVPTACTLHAPSSEFRSSRWFTRGWTLQELIAPRYVVFLSSDWIPLGTKATLYELIEEITGINVGVLVFTQELADVSVACRMSWASSRQTTRLEDEAYSLMGIFGVHMTTIYGEGRMAFRRLQEEILRQIDDHTLFVWGRRFIGGIEDICLVQPVGRQKHASYLLAPGPSAFMDSVQSTMYHPRRHVNSLADFRHDWTWTEFTVTNIGVRCEMPVASAGDWAVAMLNCEDRTGHRVGLLLRKDWNSSHFRRLPCYAVGASIELASSMDVLSDCRFVRIDQDIMGILGRLVARTARTPRSHRERNAPTHRSFHAQELYITHHLSPAARIVEHQTPLRLDIEDGHRTGWGGDLARFGFEFIDRTPSNFGAPWLPVAMQWSLKFCHRQLTKERFTILLTS